MKKHFAVKASKGNSRGCKIFAASRYGGGTIGPDGVLHSDDLFGFLREILGGNPFDYLLDAAHEAIQTNFVSPGEKYELDSIGVESAKVEGDTIKVEAVVDFRILDGRSSIGTWHPERIIVDIPYPDR